MTEFPVFAVYVFSVITCVSSVDILQSNNKFANNLYAILTKENENSFFSPLSAHIILTMVYQGATNITARTLQNTLNLPGPRAAEIEYKGILTELNTIKDIQLHIANNVYIQERHKLKSKFETSMHDFFEAEIQKTDFSKATEAADQINKWVESKTNNKIKNIILPNDINEYTQLVLVNAVYFKGLWLHPFKKENTHEEKFYTSETDSVNCEMMHITRKYLYAKRSDIKAKILKMPYVNEHTNLIIILPNARTGIKQLEKQIAYRDFNSIVQGLTETEVKVSLPKFKIETTMDLSDSLVEMGLENIFSEEAEFGNMLESTMPLKVSKIVQKAFIEIDEKGSEASAATGALMRRKRSLDEPLDEFYVDKSCVFYIEINSAIIFMGKLFQPNTLHVHDEF